jgi:tetratricopeptide (TPR) repeat protein
MDSNFAWVHTVLGRVYVQKSLYGAAIEEFQKAIDLSRGSREYMAELGHAYALAGKNEEAHKILEELQKLSKQKYADACQIAMVYVGLGDIDGAFHWLEKAFEERAYYLIDLKVEPRFDRIRLDPRYKALLGMTQSSWPGKIFDRCLSPFRLSRTLSCIPNFLAIEKGESPDATE